MDVAADRIKLWVPDLTSRTSDWMPFPHRFLGRHVRPGATFEVEVVEDGLASGISVRTRTAPRRLNSRESSPWTEHQRCMFSK